MNYYLMVQNFDCGQMRKFWCCIYFITVKRRDMPRISLPTTTGRDVWPSQSAARPVYQSNFCWKVSALVAVSFYSSNLKVCHF